MNADEERDELEAAFAYARRCSLIGIVMMVSAVPVGLLLAHFFPG